MTLRQTKIPCNIEFDSSSSCWFVDPLCKPEPCIGQIGDCPEGPPQESSSVYNPPCDQLLSYMRGMRDLPRPWFGENRAVFTTGGVVQYFWVPPEFEPVRPHSQLAFTWNSAGRLQFIDLDDAKVPRKILFDRNNPKDQEDEIPNSSSSSCPTRRDSLGASQIFPTKGALVRIQALRGSYGCINPTSSKIISPSSSAGSTDHVKVLFPQSELLCVFNGTAQNIIQAADPTLSNIASELALRFDSAGKLKKVYGGGRFFCDENPCIWDRDGDNDTSGVYVPFLQATQLHGLDDPGSFDVWCWRYDACGNYMYSVLYMRICSCIPTCTHDHCESLSSPQPFCECRDLCLVTPGCSGLIYDPRECPATVSIDCAQALITECVDDIVVPGDCVYTWQGDCCQLPADSNSSQMVLGGISSDASLNRGCFYTGGNAIKTCEVHEVR